MLLRDKIAGIFSLLLISSTAFAAEVRYHDGALMQFSNISGSGIAENQVAYLTTESAESGVDHVTSDVSATCNTFSSIWPFDDCGKSMTDLHISASANSVSYVTGYSYNTTASVSAMSEAGHPGYFMIVAPSNDTEKVGDGVKINIDISPNVMIQGDNMNAWIKGLNDMDEFVIALNPILDETGMPNEESIIYSHANINAPVAFSSQESIEIYAEVGDVFAVFAEVGCSTTQADTVFRYVSICMPVSFEVSLISNPADINNDGKVNMLDLSIIAENWFWDRAQAVNSEQ